MRRLLVNDCLSALPGHRTFWNDLQDWFGMEFAGGTYESLDNFVDLLWEEISGRAATRKRASLIIRNASYFGPLKASETIPTISLLQDIFTEGLARKMQEAVICSSRITVFNSPWTLSHYQKFDTNLGVVPHGTTVIPLPVDFSLFEPQNPMGCQQALSLPDGCICWIGACQGAAGHVKGWDTFIQIARLNPDLYFVAVLKDGFPESIPPNVRCYVRLTHEELVKVIGACRVGLCTSRMESQHLAGIEMGACGLPMVAPEVGIYWKRVDFPGIHIVQPDDMKLQAYANGIRVELSLSREPQIIREYWRKEFDREVIREKWTKLIEEIECSGQY